MRTYTFRLKPGQDLLYEIEQLAHVQAIEAGCILCSVGSLMHASFRLANREFTSQFEGPFEVVSLTGTVSVHGSHLHLSVSDGEGKTIGGHLMEGCTVYTTAEIVVAAFDDVIYRRELLQDDSGYEELVVRPR